MLKTQIVSEILFNTPQNTAPLISTVGFHGVPYPPCPWDKSERPQSETPPSDVLDCPSK